MFYSSVVQLVHDGWKIIENTFGHATSYLLNCTFDYKGVLVRAMNLRRDQKSLARTGERWKIPLSHRVLRIEGSAQHCPCTCMYR